MKINFAVGMLFPCLALTSFAAPPKSSPQGMERTYAQNYRDMVLATCIANAYKGEKNYCDGCRKQRHCFTRMGLLRFGEKP